MRFIGILFLPLMMVGCAAPKTATIKPVQPAPVLAAYHSKEVEARYELRGYREPADPGVRHEAHAIYRRTRVPLSTSEEQAVASRTSAPPASLAPLPASEELAAELATQRAITRDIRSMQVSVAETEKKMQAQYALMLRQSAEIAKTHEALKSERKQGKSATPEAAPTRDPSPAAGTPAVKW